VVGRDLIDWHIAEGRRVVSQAVPPLLPMNGVLPPRLEAGDVRLGELSERRFLLASLDSTGANTALGSAPVATASRISVAIRRAVASETADEPPRPTSTRLPPTTAMNTQDRAPAVVIRRYRPPPSACRPGSFSAVTSRAVRRLSVRILNSGGPLENALSRALSSGLVKNHARFLDVL
jgi:hypothetical protein